MPEFRSDILSAKQDRAPGMRPRPPLFRHLLVCLDRSSGARRVLEEAVALAATCGAKLTAIRVLPVPARDVHVVDPVEWDLTRREELERLRWLAQEVGAPEDMALLVKSGPPAQCLCRTALETGADLTVVGAGEWRRSSGPGLGGTAHCVVEGLTSSVLIVPTTANNYGSSGAGHRILVPLDGSPHAEATLRIAVQIAQERSAELVLLHAVSEAPVIDDAPLTAEDKALCAQFRSRCERLARTRLERIRRLLPANTIRSRVRVLKEEAPRRALARAVSEEGGELLVLSARGIGNNPDLPVGSTAEYLISHSETPVLLIREAQEKNAHPMGRRAPRCPGTLQENA